ncbi:MAG: hypothetical protein ACRD4S_16520 [Candidatus Acidiferrales bacterium]
MHQPYKPPASARALDLWSPFLKVKWAKNHIDNLGNARIKFLGNNRYLGVPKYNVETNRTQYIVGTVPEITPEIRLLVGDIAHNLRTALDHLACELCHSVGIAEPKVYFPICESREIYEAESGRKTQGMPKEAKDFIDTLCPYGGDGAGGDYLFGLHELDRFDKHRLILTVTMRVGSYSMTLSPQGAWFNIPMLPVLKPGDVIGEIEGNCESDKQMSVTADIAFGEPQVFKGEPLFPTLPILADHIERIIALFGPNPAK